MTEAPVLDTHAWIWWVDRDSRLETNIIRALDRLPAHRRPYVCDISLWEVATLVERGRLSFAIPLKEWLESAAHPRTARILDVTPEIADATASLPPDFQRDPADRLIVATCRVMGLPLLTKDRLIIQSKLVRCWKA